MKVKITALERKEDQINVRQLRFFIFLSFNMFWTAINILLFHWVWPLHSFTYVIHYYWNPTSMNNIAILLKSLQEKIFNIYLCTVNFKESHLPPEQTERVLFWRSKIYSDYGRKVTPKTVWTICSLPKPIQCSFL
jgi:hypothetical protein